jgi:hypothetical protein
VAEHLSSDLQAGVSIEAVIAAILNSQEYASNLG